MSRPAHRPAVAGAILLLLAGTAAEAQRARGQNLQVRRTANGNLNHGANFNRNATINRNANVNRNINVNRNANINVNRNVNVSGHVDVHGGYYYRDYDDYHPFAVAAAAATTALVVGSIVRSIPPSCVNVVVGSVTYFQCGSTWYQPRYVGTSVQYVVVTAPR